MSIRYAKQGQVVVVTLDRPGSMNALDPQSMCDLRDAFLQYDSDPETRVMILTGAGDKAFCAGTDLKKTLPQKPYVTGFFDRDIPADHPSYVRNMSLPRLGISKPVIAAVNGVAVGGGMELALNADIVICTPHARFGLPEARIGSIPAVSGIQRLMQSLPRSVAMKLLLTGEIIDAAQAQAYGLVSEVVSGQDLLERAHEIATEIAGNAPLAVRAIKYLAEKAQDLPLKEALDVEELVWGHLHATEDRIEGRKAFAEKRPPEYKGR